jgi:hypothetical protein
VTVQEQDFQTPPRAEGDAQPPLFDERSAQTAHRVVPLAAVERGWRARVGAWRGSLAGVGERPWLFLMALFVAALVGAATYSLLARRASHAAPPEAASGETPARTNTQAVNRDDDNKTNATNATRATNARPADASPSSAGTADDARAQSGEEPSRATDQVAPPATAGGGERAAHARTRRAFRPRTTRGGARLVSVIH